MTSKENCAKQLADVQVQEKLAEVLSFYFDDLQDILQLASAQNDGKRPENLSNEIFSCFHHIARGLCAGASTEDTLDECGKALDSHLKRATLDSYKIAVNAFLDRDTKLREILDYLVLVDDFEKYLPDGLMRINEIQSIAQKVRELLRLAKRDEAHGQFSEATDHFTEALNNAVQLESKVSVFTTNKTYLLACAREARERKERKKDRSNAIRAAIISAVLSAILAATCTLGIQKLLSDNPATGDSSQKDGRPPTIQSTTS